MTKINKVKSLLISEYEIRDLVRATYLLDTIIEYEESKMKLSQTLCLNKLLSEYGMDDYKTCKTPIEPRIKLSKCDICKAMFKR